MSFNFGPTLTAWLARNEPELLTYIVEADRVSCEQHAGYGNAIAVGLWACDPSFGKSTG